MIKVLSTDDEQTIKMNVWLQAYIAFVNANNCVSSKTARESADVAMDYFENKFLK